MPCKHIKLLLSKESSRPLLIFLKNALQIINIECSLKISIFLLNCLVSMPFKSLFSHSIHNYLLNFFFFFLYLDQESVQTQISASLLWDFHKSSVSNSIEECKYCRAFLAAPTVIGQGYVIWNSASTNFFTDQAGNSFLHSPPWTSGYAEGEQL